MPPDPDELDNHLAHPKVVVLQLWDCMVLLLWDQEQVC